MTPPLTTTLDEPEGTITRKVRISETLFQQLGAESVEWGEPDEDGFYTPALRRAAQPAPPTEALRLLDALVKWWDDTETWNEGDEFQPIHAMHDEDSMRLEVLIDEARRYLAATEEGT